MNGRPSLFSTQPTETHQSVVLLQETCGTPVLLRKGSARKGIETLEQRPCEPFQAQPLLFLYGKSPLQLLKHFHDGGSVGSFDGNTTTDKGIELMTHGDLAQLASTKSRLGLSIREKVELSRGTKSEDVGGVGNLVGKLGSLGAAPPARPIVGFSAVPRLDELGESEIA